MQNINYEESLGFSSLDNPSPSTQELIHYINIKLRAQGFPVFKKSLDENFFKISDPFLRHHRERTRLLSNYYCPADQRIHNFLDGYFKDVAEFKGARLPSLTFLVARHGVARALSLAPDADNFESKYIQSYRVPQGVIHNPRNDRRTTKGVFHVVEGGLPVADDKFAVPKIAFVRMFKAALNPPAEEMRLPFTSTQDEQAELFLSLLLRPKVCPEVPGWQSEKSMEIRFFAPGGLVSNLDFVESIFGNAGDPFMPQNDAALDSEHWTGHTGCVILAPHLNHLTKKDLGLPHVSKATARQKRDGMCWSKESEKYNNGSAFKVTCRDASGVIVTIIADNYFGYCKKEVKTQIGYSANLFGLAEEEHAGGAIAFPSYDLGEQFDHSWEMSKTKATFAQVKKNFKDAIDFAQDGNYGRDKNFSKLVYVPENTSFSLLSATVSWSGEGKGFKIPLHPDETYMLPSGFRIRMKKHGANDRWRLVGTQADGVLCHKPCTVSGGGKSEISKPLTDTMLTGPIYVNDLEKDFALVEDILNRDFSTRFIDSKKIRSKRRSILSKDRSLGSVIKLLTPSADYTKEHNDWIASIPAHVKTLIFVIKRLYNPSWGKNWRDHFRVDVINGASAHELKFKNRPLSAYYFRVGFDSDGLWRVFNTRYDFYTSDKLQVEDDITCSIVVPSKIVKDAMLPTVKPSVKLVQNCEYRLFQRPDDAIHPGHDKTTEKDLAMPGRFLSNFEPLNQQELKKIADNILELERYSDPMKNLIKDSASTDKFSFFSISSKPRIVDGKPTKNPRYLQDRPDMIDSSNNYIAQMSTRVFKNIPIDKPLIYPVDAVLPGRRNNRPEPENNVPALAVYNPIHYQELPELFMDFISSVTGKSPSTTGFGSEGALTKGPFNALQAAADLNSAFLSYAVSGYNGFTSAAGVIGPNVEVGHDISLLIPEIWSRMAAHEREPEFLIKNGCLEKVNDFTYQGELVPASILGYRITLKFVNLFLGRIFNNPDIVFTPEMLRPELQDESIFVEGIYSLMSTHQRVAKGYLNDGAVDDLCPPLQALIHIMASGNYKGQTLQSASVRQLFTRESVLKSVWYKDRLKEKQRIEIQLFEKHLAYVDGFLKHDHNQQVAQEMNLRDRKKQIEKQLKTLRSSAYLKSLEGTIGAQKFR